MTPDNVLRAHLTAVFGQLNTAAAARAFPPPATLSKTLGGLIPIGANQRNADGKTASYFATAAVDIWHRAVHSFLVSAALTTASPIWASVSGYYASHYAIRGLAHLLGFFQLYQKKCIVQLKLHNGTFIVIFTSRNGGDREHKLYWKMVKGNPVFHGDNLFTENDPSAEESDIRHRNHANYADHLAGRYPIIHPLDSKQLSDRIDFISKIRFDAPPLPRFSRFPDVEYVQLIAYHRIIDFRMLVDEIVGPKNRFWKVHRSPAFATDYMDFQLVRPDSALSAPS